MKDLLKQGMLAQQMAPSWSGLDTSERSLRPSLKAEGVSTAASLAHGCVWWGLVVNVVPVHGWRGWAFGRMMTYLHQWNLAGSQFVRE